MDKIEQTQRQASEATEAAARKILVLLELLRTRAIRFSTYERVHGRDYRTFQRDLQHLRKIGDEAGLRISPIRGKERAELSVERSGLSSLDASEQVRGLLGVLGGALGSPVASELGQLAEAPSNDEFLRLLLPQLVAETQIAQTYHRLKAAWAVRPGPAIVSFEYDPGKGAKTVRRVEPYRLLFRSGSYYLVGYDLDKKGWRFFALDRICSVPTRAGTIQQLRRIPPAYESSDTIGFFKSTSRAIVVTVELTPAVAASAISRRWQAAQRVEQLPGGHARISFEVTEIGEVVRWALGFGKEARIISPPEAVQVALQTIAGIVAAYNG